MNYLRFLTKIFFPAAILVLFFAPLSVFAVSDPINVSVEVNAAYCNNNGVCEPVLGEYSAGCSNDCGCNNDGICQRDQRLEDENNCPRDCIVYPIHSGTWLKIINLSVEKITLNSADIVWDTTVYALCKISWGKTSEYKDGGISEVNYSESHVIKLAGLIPQTRYHFKIICTSMLDNKAETPDQEFSTLTPLDNIPPANVSDFNATAGDKKITLDWNNPSDADFKGVRILKSEKFYPSDIWDGEIIYDGKANSFIDNDVENGKRYYYTIFSYDKSGNYSSGAIASAVPQSEEGPIIVPPVLPEDIPSEIPISPEIDKLKLEDFDFFLNNEKISLKNGKIIGINSEDILSVSIDYKKVPEVLKTIMVTLEKENKFFSFLLRINQDKTAYTAAMASPKDPGVYPLTITILDYKNHTMKKIFGELLVKGVEELSKGFLLWQSKNSLIFHLVLYFLFAVLFIVLIKILKKIKRKKQINLINKIKI